MQCSPPRVTRSRPQVPGSPNARSRLADRSPQVGPRGQVRNDLTVLPSTSYWRAAGTRACVRAQEPGVSFVLFGKAEWPAGENFSPAWREVAIRFPPLGGNGNPSSAPLLTPAPPLAVGGNLGFLWSSCRCGCSCGADLGRVLRRGLLPPRAVCSSVLCPFFSFQDSRALHCGLRLQMCCLWAWIVLSLLDYSTILGMFLLFAIEPFEFESSLSVDSW